MKPFRETSVTEKALDFYGRIGLGQIEEIVRVLTRHVPLVRLDDDQYLAKVSEIRVHINAIKAVLGFGPGESYGVGNPAVHEDVREAFRLVDEIREKEGSNG